MIHTSTPDNMPPEIGIPLAIIAWIVLILVILIQRKRAQVRLQKAVRLAVLANRREAYIEAANAEDEALNKELAQESQKRERR